jgi:hypothetical protein
VRVRSAHRTDQPLQPPRPLPAGDAHELQRELAFPSLVMERIVAWLGLRVDATSPGLTRSISPAIDLPS